MKNIEKIEYKRISITIPIKLLDKFKKFCKINGINISSKISILIKEDLENKRLRTEE